MYYKGSFPKGKHYEFVCYECHNFVQIDFNFPQQPTNGLPHAELPA